MSRTARVIESDDEIPGYTSDVHQSLLETIRWGGVPYTPCVANLFMTFMISITWQSWKYLPVGALIHGLLFLLTWGDARRIEKIIRYLHYKPYYAPRVVRRRRKVGKVMSPHDDFYAEALQDPAIREAARVVASLPSGR